MEEKVRKAIEAVTVMMTLAETKITPPHLQWLMTMHSHFYLTEQSNKVLRSTPSGAPGTHIPSILYFLNLNMHRIFCFELAE